MNSVRDIVQSRFWRAAAAGAVLAVTALFFVRFFLAHPQYWQQLGHIRFGVFAAVFGLNILQLAALVGVGYYILRLCQVRLAWAEQALLTAYSAVVNFFGPLQSGPAVRAVYLKAKHGVRLRDYTKAALVYYALFAFVNAAFVLGFSRPWWQTLLGLLAVSVLCWLVMRWFSRRPSSDNQSSRFQLTSSALGGLLAATLVQVLLLAACYLVELRAVDGTVTLKQALVYSGAANFALFVSITPDAIGFREAFLIFSQRLHHLSTAVILAANVIDRAVYVVFLLVVLALTIVTHAARRLRVDPATSAADSQSH